MFKCRRASGPGSCAPKVRHWRYAGEVASWVADLGAAWEAERQRARTKVTDEDAVAMVTIEAPVPRHIRWEWTTPPARRVMWSSEPMEVIEDLANGRRGVGTVNHCAHGKDLSVRGDPRLGPS
jgi:hypothetical protein